jgi:DNA repair exonuclease SbcCD ATPase subunit
MINGRNGSGKSSLFEILTMGVYGNTCSSRDDSS